jgi:hypothetical protein
MRPHAQDSLLKRGGVNELVMQKTVPVWKFAIVETRLYNKLMEMTVGADKLKVGGRMVGDTDLFPPIPPHGQIQCHPNR